MMTNPLEAAKQEGYSEQEIADYFSKKDPKMKQALDNGYSLEEISSYLQKQPEESPEKGAFRSLWQLGTGYLVGKFRPLMALDIISQVGYGEALAEFDELEDRKPQLKKEFPDIPWDEILNRESFEEAAKNAQASAPYTLGGAGEIVEQFTGAPTGRPRTEGQQVLGLAGMGAGVTRGGLLSKALGAVSVPATEHILRDKLKIPEPFASWLSFLTTMRPGKKGGEVPTAKDFKKLRKEVPIPRTRKKPFEGEPPGGPGSPPGAPPGAPPAGPGSPPGAPPGAPPAGPGKPPGAPPGVPPAGPGSPPGAPPGAPPAGPGSPPGAPPGVPPAGPGKPPPVSPTGGFVEEIERFPSGLTKPKAVEAKRAEMGIITPGQQERALEGLNKEAAHLTTKKFQEIFPTAKKVMEGYDMEGAFKKGFGELEAQAGKANPDIDIDPLTKFLREEQGKYRGIPTLDKEAKKIMKWIEDFRSNPQTSLKNLMKIYRSVNRELKGVFDRAKLSGVPNHYVNFLSRANKEIANSIRQTLPKDSVWMKRFDALNKEFKNYKDAQIIAQKLRPLLQGEPTAANLRKFANDPKLQKLLELKMGKEAAREIIQIAKDLETAQKAINRMSAKTVKELDDIYPIPLLLVGMKVPGLGYVTKKVAEGVRRLYGRNLLNPTTRKVYREAIEAAGKGDYPAYKKATDALRKEQGLIGYDEPKKLGFKEPKLLGYKPQPKKTPGGGEYKKAPTGPSAKTVEKIAKTNISKPAEQANKRGMEILDKVFESNPRFKLSQYLEEKPTLRRLVDIPGGSQSVLTKYYTKKEWDKYFDPKLYEKYYDQGRAAYKELGKLDDWIKDPFLKKKYKGILDVPVQRSELHPALGLYRVRVVEATGEQLYKILQVHPNMTPQMLHSVIVHEGVHGLQYELPSKGSKFSRGARRYREEKEIPYAERLNEVKARQFQDWIDKPVNEYRTKLEKTKEARRLWEEQTHPKPKEDTRNFFEYYYKLNDKGRKIYNEWAEKYGSKKSYTERIQIIERLAKIHGN